MRSAIRLALLVSSVTATRGDAQPRMLNVGDATLRYDVTGQGPAVVFIHGWTQSLDIWDDQVAAFSPRYRVVRYDRRGYGESTGYADASADPADLRALLDSLGIKTAALVGLSAGANVALRFALSFPDRLHGLVLYGSGPPDEFPGLPPGPSPMEQFAELARRHGMDSLRRVLVNTLVYVPAGRPEVRERSIRRLDEYKGLDLLDPKPQSGRVPPARFGQLGSVRAPTLVLNGDHDLPLFLVVADSLAKRIPGARKVIIKDGGHGAHFAQPELFNDALRAFFASLTPR